MDHEGASDRTTWTGNPLEEGLYRQPSELAFPLEESLYHPPSELASL